MATDGDDYEFLIDESKSRLQTLKAGLEIYSKKFPEDKKGIAKFRSLIQKEKDRYDIYCMFQAAEHGSMLSFASSVSIDHQLNEQNFELGNSDEIRQKLSPNAIQDDMSEFSFLISPRADGLVKIPMDQVLHGGKDVPLGQRVIKMPKNLDQTIRTVRQKLAEEKTQLKDVFEPKEIHHPGKQASSKNSSVQQIQQSKRSEELVKPEPPKGMAKKVIIAEPKKK